MANRDIYDQQVALLVRILPHLAQETVLALKGGTAINLFFRDLPRLSVDLDLTYLPVESYDASLEGIDAALGRLAAGIKGGIPGAQIHAQQSAEGHVERLHVQAGVAIKIEVTPVLRGVVYEPAMMPVTDAVEARFGFAETLVVSKPDLYAGKLVAALDRQHPRDLHDVRLLLAEDGVSNELRRAFIAYVLSSARPLNVILNPPRRDLTQKFAREFEGMTEEPVTLDDLHAAWEDMIRIMIGDMPQTHRRFLMSFKRGEPDWSLLGLAHAAELPAVKYRVHKLAALTPSRRQAEIDKLRDVLFPDGE
ncbi:nucleotidyl transferase AbiEii/AbiGii toxin family protein [Phenylobacterium sp.]|uniref:nucleotidyl transferase AbiEii/AbiGii toxin family protein n=1 Tax=Phenylobacterium sp. TaxID=1871053 RepID=UPI0025DAC07B|nr:nucleotidyl transferase AbiEii/AbiGii toxin family protein [Phenylobacterium sp.]MBX3484794.1 nucleotidyl transferase AbiEii/AbiGii toxin family protein [Phenylobacterium sp.]